MDLTEHAAARRLVRVKLESPAPYLALLLWPERHGWRLLVQQGDTWEPRYANHLAMPSQTPQEVAPLVFEGAVYSNELSRLEAICVAARFGLTVRMNYRALKATSPDVRTIDVTGTSPMLVFGRDHDRGLATRSFRLDGISRVEVLRGAPVWNGIDYQLVDGGRDAPLPF